MANKPDAKSQKNKTEYDTLGKLRKLYSKYFPNTNCHHPTPISRVAGPADGEEAQANRLIVFPYNVDAHDAYHQLLWNLRIDQVWDMLDDIHSSIFETQKEFIKQWWIKDCNLESGDSWEKKDFNERKSERLVKLLPVSHFKGLWLKAFGTEDFKTARNLIRIMMLFMIFREKIVNQTKLFDDNFLKSFFKNFKPANDHCQWAMDTVFGSGGCTLSIKSKIASILRRNKFYYIKKSSA